MTDTLDVLEIGEGRSAVGLSSTDISQDAKLGPLITAVSRRLDILIGPIVQRTITNEAHDGGTSYIDLANSPIASVTSITEYAGTTGTALSLSANTTQPASGYLLKMNSFGFYKGRVYRRNGNTDGWFPQGMGNVLITYVAGRYADTSSVDARYKQAAAFTLANLFRREQRPASPNYAGPEAMSDVGHSAFPSFALPNAALELLIDEIPPGVA